MTHRPALQRSDGEVARIVEVPVCELLDPARLVEDEQVRDGRRLLIPAFRVAAAKTPSRQVAQPRCRSLRGCAP